VESLTLHRAPWIFPVSGPAIADGIVAADGERIVDIGTSTDLLNRYPSTRILRHDGCVLLPALINAHIHLELSHLPIPRYRERVDGFTDWIATLLDARDQNGATGNIVETAARQVMMRQHQTGIIALGDIGNTDLGSRLQGDFPGELLHFQEFLGRSAKTRRSVLTQIAAAPDSSRCTAHAPYSTHGELIQALKDRARRLGHPFPIHVAEPPSEVEMLTSASGELHSFLSSRKFIDDSYRPPSAIDNPGSVQYLHTLGVLDRQTICIHCVHVSPAEIRILTDTGARVCLCPGSNKYLRVGTAPVGMLLDHGILPALGTDSLASNPELSIWQEMQLLHTDHPAIGPERILAMATLGGAAALGLDHIYGSLAPGKSSRFLAVRLEEPFITEPMVYDYLVSGGNRIQPAWVNRA